MRLRSHPRVERRPGGSSRFTAASAVELLLLALIAVQAARLVWTLATPVGPVGDYKGSSPAFVSAGGASLGEFDPFFRLSSAGGQAAVTSLDLKLYGVREDRATGRGSAIIALPSGEQRSFAVGEEIMPGVTLSEVGFDGVTIARGGTPEQIFLDQSTPAPEAGQAAAPAQAPTQAPAPARTPPPIIAPAAAPASAASGQAIRFQPRVGNGQVDGIAVSPGADGGQAFRAAGFEPGDVIVSVNGQRVSSTEQALALVRQSSGRSTIIVNRGGRAVPIRSRLNL